MGDGTKDRVVGHVKEAAGDLTDNKDLEREGKIDKATGNIKDKLGDIADRVKETVDEVGDRLNKK